ncbi:37S ribosomal protein S24, mitochondrial [Xanthoria calcicola]
MAVAFNRLGFATLRHSCRIQCRRKEWMGLSSRRPFQSAPAFRARSDGDDRSGPRKPPKEPYSFNYDQLVPEERHHYDLLSPEEKKKFQADERAAYEHLTSPEMESELQGMVSQAVYDISRKAPRERDLPPRITPGLMAMGEVDEQDSGEDEDFEGDDITSIAHGELEQHREIREYARIAAWEMPMLSKLAKPFVLPPQDKPLRFRYTTYMGETHPAAKKVVLEFCTRDLPGLSEAQRIKLVKLIGVRYNPDTDLVKMSCEMFETQAQNKRYLGDLVDTLMAEARDASDMFEDVPLDFRHHKPKPKFEFPEQWKLTEERRAQLDQNLKQRELAEKEREEAGRLVDGAKIIEQVMEAMTVKAPAAVRVEAPKGKGKKRLPMR